MSELTLLHPSSPASSPIHLEETAQPKPEDKGSKGTEIEKEISEESEEKENEVTNSLAEDTLAKKIPSQSPTAQLKNIEETPSPSLTTQLKESESESKTSRSSEKTPSSPQATKSPLTTPPQEIKKTAAPPSYLNALPTFATMSSQISSNTNSNAGGKYNFQPPPPFAFRPPTSSVNPAPTGAPITQASSQPNISMNNFQGLNSVGSPPMGSPLSNYGYGGSGGGYGSTQPLQPQYSAQGKQQSLGPPQGYPPQDSNNFQQQQQHQPSQTQHNQQHNQQQQGYSANQQFQSHQGDANKAPMNRMQQPNQTHGQGPSQSSGNSQSNSSDQKEDQNQQMMAKLNSMMHLMSSFMKSVDARLTTLERMLQQVSNTQTEQMQIMDRLRSGDAGQRGGPSYAPPSANIAQQTPPPYLPDPSPPAPSYLPEFRPQPSYNTHAQKTRQELEDEEMARRLQQEFAMEAEKEKTKKTVEQNMSSHSMYPDPSGNRSGGGDGTEECPLCGLVLPFKDLEVHVQMHLDTSEGAPPPQRPANQKPQEKSLWDRLFGSDDESTQAPRENRPPAPNPPYGNYSYPPQNQQQTYAQQQQQQQAAYAYYQQQQNR